MLLLEALPCENRLDGGNHLVDRRRRMEAAVGVGARCAARHDLHMGILGLAHFFLLRSTPAGELLSAVKIELGGRSLKQHFLRKRWFSNSKYATSCITQPFRNFSAT